MTKNWYGWLWVDGVYDAMAVQRNVGGRTLLQAYFAMAVVCWILTLSVIYFDVTFVPDGFTSRIFRLLARSRSAHNSDGTFSIYTLVLGIAILLPHHIVDLGLHVRNPRPPSSEIGAFLRTASSAVFNGLPFLALLFLPLVLFNGHYVTGTMLLLTATVTTALKYQLTR